MSITMTVALISGCCLSASLLIALGLGAAAARGDEQLEARHPGPDEARPPAQVPASRVPLSWIASDCRSGRARALVSGHAARRAAVRHDLRRR